MRPGSRVEAHRFSPAGCRFGAARPALGPVAIVERLFRRPSLCYGRVIRRVSTLQRPDRRSSCAVGHR
ncbi:hypothetical protein AArcMg_1237 [Natrarchaeobaculum sulfurireducens]|uniref:Uncharacterized protein n=1 Tax=Natrarchaeobaculum sulfurireducens TaxID=2044521 RepID=A0A346PP08_9EURY|nr:hypothetical protein AArc1_2380 [Natrarchaeobaculum sulfurireducens]AXR81253.1 hypothetical protein AArcMg_1237 [Natrarchaeobaculum sulfurireducens]